MQGIAESLIQYVISNAVTNACLLPNCVDLFITLDTIDILFLDVQISVQIK